MSVEDNLQVVDDFEEAFFLGGAEASLRCGLP